RGQSPHGSKPPEAVRELMKGDGTPAAVQDFSKASASSRYHRRRTGAIVADRKGDGLSAIPRRASGGRLQYVADFRARTVAAEPSVARRLITNSSARNLGRDGAPQFALARRDGMDGAFCAVLRSNSNARLSALSACASDGTQDCSAAWSPLGLLVGLRSSGRSCAISTSGAMPFFSITRPAGVT